MTWYDQAELVGQADGDKTQPEFAIDSQTTLDPSKSLSAADQEQATEGYGAAAKTTALLAGLQRIQDIITAEITNSGEGASADVPINL